METRKLLEVLSVAERLKDATRHCYTSGGRRESVAEHSWRITLMAYLVSDEFPEADLTKLLKMCLIHDLGEAFTGDIPTFDKTDSDEAKEAAVLDQWVRELPQPFAEEMRTLYREMDERKTLESRIYKALDNLEALIQHNESDISTWIPLEYDLQMTYGNDKVQFSEYLRSLRDEIRNDSIAKIQEAENSGSSVQKIDKETQKEVN
nr:HD domain-containing protein [uncultured Blautia sp.]